MSDTPRMKAAQMAAMEHGTGDVWRVGCDIERELNAAQQRIKQLEEAGDEARAERDEAAKVVEKALSELGQSTRRRCALIDRIKRLEEALEGTVKWIVRLADSGDAGFWNTEEQSVIIAARAALKKEGK